MSFKPNYGDLRYYRELPPDQSMDYLHRISFLQPLVQPLSGVTSEKQKMLSGGPAVPACQTTLSSQKECGTAYC